MWRIPAFAGHQPTDTTATVTRLHRVARYRPVKEGCAADSSAATPDPPSCAGGAGRVIARIQARGVGHEPASHPAYFPDVSAPPGPNGRHRDPVPPGKERLRRQRLPPATAGGGWAPPRHRA